MIYCNLNRIFVIFGERANKKRRPIEASLESGLVFETVSYVINLGFQNLHHYTKGKIQVAHGSSPSITVNLLKL